MPEISRFYGIVIKMYFRKSEHNPPHIHAIYQDYIAAISIKEMKIISGDIPNTALKLVNEWIKIHRDELLKIWDTQEFNEIEPLE